jgi:hypothetical protein
MSFAAYATLRAPDLGACVLLVPAEKGSSGRTLT